MTESEAIKTIQLDICNGCECIENCITNQCEYFLAINALEKQIPKKPKNRYKTRYIWDSAYCPICNCGITSRWSYCQCCGQKLDFGE